MTWKDVVEERQSTNATTTCDGPRRSPNFRRALWVSRDRPRRGRIRREREYCVAAKLRKTSRDATRPPRQGRVAARSTRRYRLFRRQFDALLPGFEPKKQMAVSARRGRANLRFLDFDSFTVNRLFNPIARGRRPRLAATPPARARERRVPLRAGDERGLPAAAAARRVRRGVHRVDVGLYAEPRSAGGPHLGRGPIFCAGTLFLREGDAARAPRASIRSGAREVEFGSRPPRPCGRSARRPRGAAATLWTIHVARARRRRDPADDGTRGGAATPPTAPGPRLRPAGPRADAR